MRFNMSTIQLEFNLDNLNDSDLRFFQMQQQIDVIHQSSGKVRRKLFTEMGELKKICLDLQFENESLKKSLRELKDQKMKWSYYQANCLFQPSE